MNGLGAVVTPRVLKVIGAVVTLVWVLSIVMDAINPSYDPPDTIGLAFMAMLSAVLGAAAVRGKDDPEKSPPSNEEEDSE